MSYLLAVPIVMFLVTLSSYAIIEGIRERKTDACSKIMYEHYLRAERNSIINKLPNIDKSESFLLNQRWLEAQVLR